MTLTLLVGGPLAGTRTAWPNGSPCNAFPVGHVIARDGAPVHPPESVGHATYRRSPLGEILGRPFARHVGGPWQNGAVSAGCASPETPGAPGGRPAD